MKPAFLAICLAIGLPGMVAAQSTCAEDQVTVIGGFGRAAFTVDIADDPQERSQGLMFVEQMPRFSGMLFLYDVPHHATFWMKNTLIPLDMIFAGQTGEILKVHHNAIAGDETTIDGGGGVMAVLEINGGMAATLGISAGDYLQHPFFGEAAAVPCVD